ncbi:MAG: hypothetical protein ACKV1O_19885 [Saprospiraceae bacterium]
MTMMNLLLPKRLFTLLLGASLLFFTVACGDDDDTSLNPPDAAVFLVIDEESIDNGNPPNNFSDTDVNDQLAEVGLRLTLDYFRNNVGKTIDLFTGEVGDEGWHALKTIPASWISAGPFTNGAGNYLAAGPGLGSGTPDDNKEILLDEIPNVTPLRATGLKMLIGTTVLAVVYDSEVSINYSPLRGNLKGANLGLVAFDVLEVKERTDGSSGSLPRVTIRIRNINDALLAPLSLFSNAPVPQSSSEPFDVAPPASAGAIELLIAP